MNPTESEDYQSDVLDQTQRKLRETEKEVQKLKTQMRQANIDEIYKENDLMKRELKSMQILVDEN